jgi:DNA-binding CsgD family transcriptional regulator
LVLSRRDYYHGVNRGRFVGRREELSLLASLAAGVTEGVGAVVLVEGEQGIGKTALLRNGLSGPAVAGCEIFWAAADEMLRQIPLRLMMECLGAAAPQSELSALGADPVVAGMERLLAHVDRLCAASPIVVVTEDLQWADEASLVTWHQLSVAAGQMPLLLVGSLRSGSERADVQRLRRSVKSQGGAVLTLDALSDADVAAQVGELLGGPQGSSLAAVTTRAGGNPLYVRELAESLLRDDRIAERAGEWHVVPSSAAIPVPASLVAAIDDRLAGLAPDVLDTLRWAAMLGSEFSVTDLSVVTGLRADLLMPVVDAAMTANVLTDAGSRLGFRHGLIRQVLYEGTPASLRAALHLQAAQALAAAGALPERVAAQLAPAPGEEGPLALAAGVGQKWAAAWLVENARTLEYRAPQTAATILREVLAGLHAEDENREALQASLVRSAFHLGRDSQVESLGQELLAASADQDLAAEMAWLVGYAQLRTERPALAGSTLATALSRPAVADLWAGRLRAMRAITLSVLGDPAEAAGTGQSALECADKADDQIGVGYALHSMAFAAMHRRDDALAVDLISRALLAIGHDPRASDLRVMLLANKASCLMSEDRPGEAMAAAREVVVVAEREAGSRLAGARFILADQLFAAGQWDDAWTELDLAVRLQRQDHRKLLAHALLALIAAHRNDLPTARGQLRLLPDGPLRETGAGPLPKGGLFWDRAWLARALITEQTTGPAAAAAVLTPCLDPAVGAQLPGRLAVLPTLVRLARAAGDSSLAAAAAAEASATTGSGAGRGALNEALASHCQGLADGDSVLLSSAAARFAAAARPLAEAAVLEDMAELLATQGETAEARRALGSASSLYTRLGAKLDLQRAAARLGPYGIRQARSGPRRPATGWAALTPTELTVARLVAEGRSNPDIAAELSLSRNTVQTHVSHILAKLSARSRAEIIAEAFRQSSADRFS